MNNDEITQLQVEECKRVRICFSGSKRSWIEVNVNAKKIKAPNVTVHNSKKGDMVFGWEQFKKMLEAGNALVDYMDELRQMAEENNAGS